MVTSDRCCRRYIAIHSIETLVGAIISLVLLARLKLDRLHWPAFVLSIEPDLHALVSIFSVVGALRTIILPVRPARPPHLLHRVHLLINILLQGLGLRERTGVKCGGRRCWLRQCGR